MFKVTSDVTNLLVEDSTNYELFPLGQELGKLSFISSEAIL